MTRILMMTRTHMTSIPYSTIKQLKVSRMVILNLWNFSPKWLKAEALQNSCSQSGWWRFTRNSAETSSRGQRCLIRDLNFLSQASTTAPTFLRSKVWQLTGEDWSSRVKTIYSWMPSLCSTVQWCTLAWQSFRRWSGSKLRFPPTNSTLCCSKFLSHFELLSFRWKSWKLWVNLFFHWNISKSKQ